MKAQAILKQHLFRITRHRCDVLEHFIRSKGALTHPDLVQVFKNKIDRVSLYRILRIFSEKQILYKIVDSKGMASYVIDKESREKFKNGHPHYKCKCCNTIIELPKLPEAYLNQLSHLNIDELNILAEGTCKRCEVTTKK